jgi:hypothetical protein
MLTPPMHLIPPPVCPGVRDSPFVYFFYLTCTSFLYERISRMITLWYLDRFIREFGASLVDSF